MSMVEVHNITDRPNTPGSPRALRVGGRLLRPGKKARVDRSVLNRTFMRLQGTKVWIGKLPARFARTSRTALDAMATAVDRDQVPMEHAEARAYLEGLKLSDLMELAGKMSPPLTYRAQVSRPALCARLSRAIFQKHRELDPEVFFWLRRWKRTRGGDYLLKE